MKAGARGLTCTGYHLTARIDCREYARGRILWNAGTVIMGGSHSSDNRSGTAQCRFEEKRKRGEKGAEPIAASI